MKINNNLKIITGRVWKFGDNVDTDIIVPSQYLALSDLNEIKKHAFEPLMSNFAGQVRNGDIIIAGKNFGSGSSREQAAEVIKALGVRVVIAESFSRIFLRNAINNGLWAIENRLDVNTGETITIDLVEFSLKGSFGLISLPRFPPLIMDIVNNGGLIPYMRKKNNNE